MECDLGNLVCCSKSSLPSSLNTISSEDLKNVATHYVQELANKLWELPTEIVEGVTVAQLPDPSIRLPREKPCPKPKMETKWSRFAKLKGITKKKKGRLVWSDDLKQWVPRWGYKSENNEKDWMLEVPDKADPFEDQFEKKANAKREKIAKNELQRLRNISKNAKGKVTGIGMMPNSKPDGKPELNEKLLAVKKSTASMGDFDEKVKGEEKVKMAKKRKFESNFRDSGKEKERNLELFARVKSGKAIVDKDKAARNLQVAEEAIRAKRRKTDGGSFDNKNKKQKTQKKDRGTSKHNMQKKKDSGDKFDPKNKKPKTPKKVRGTSKHSMQKKK